nr:transposase [Pelobacter seleniigenes]
MLVSLPLTASTRLLSTAAFGQGQEHGLLEPIIEQIDQAFQADDRPLSKETKVLADSGFCNKDTLHYLEHYKIDGYLADHGFRSRDPRFADADKYKPKSPQKITAKMRFTAADFQVDLEQQTCICPAGKSLWLKCTRAKIQNHIFMGHRDDCDTCSLRFQCLRSVKQKGARQVNILLEHIASEKTGPLQRMKQKIDSKLGRHIYSQRLGIVEPVFGHICEAIGIRRFTLRSKAKVNGQWQLMAMLHNLTKIHRFGAIA